MNTGKLTERDVWGMIALIILICIISLDGCSISGNDSDRPLRKIEVQAAVKGYLRENLNDWNSYKSVSWSEVTDLDPGYTIVHRYRAKNAFGGYITKTTKCYVDENGVVRYTEGD